LIPGELLGQLAALGTSLCFTAGSVFFTLASRQVGVVVLNRARLLTALALLALAHWIILGSPWPATAGPAQWLWLGLSGAVGLALGDLFLFQGFKLVGPRLTMLMMSLSPILTALLAWAFLKETLTPWQWLGIGITLLGIVWVVLDNHRATEQGFNKLGMLAGLGAVICQSAGLVLARPGLAAEFSPLSGNFIRMFSATSIIWLVTIIQRQAGDTLTTIRSHPNSGRTILAGAFLGPFLGVSLSLLAIQHAEVGVASTLMALPPVLLLPVSYLFFKERFGYHAVLGTLFAMAGIAILFLV
jgi:drug/metabolite transporter (DMT)-like permease